MTLLRLIFVAFFAVLLAGCLQVEKVVKLSPDGSGTIEETVVLTKSALASLQQMAGSFGGGGGDKAAIKTPEIFDEAKLKSAAAQMGEGVTYVSGQKIENESGQGFKAVYAFADVSKLKLDQNPGDVLPAAGNAKPEKSKKEPIVIHFTKGSPAEASFTMPPPEFKPKKDPQPEAMEDMAMQMMKQIFKDMRISMAIEVNGNITETNAQYREGSRITIMDMDFNKVMADPEKFKALAKANPQSVQEAKTLINGLDGVKVETSPEIHVKFQ